MQYPVSCLLRHGGEEFYAEVINYHFGGACIKIPEKYRSHRDQGDYKLDFYLGKSCIQKSMGYKVCWNDLEKSGMIGILFKNKIKFDPNRQERFNTNQKFPITILATDPLDPLRTVSFLVKDMSETGLLIQSSLANRHLFPGLSLKGATASGATSSNLDLDLVIENTRISDSKGDFLLGVSVIGDRLKYSEYIRAYFSNYGLPVVGENVAKLKKANLLGRKLKGSVNYRSVETEAEYQKVLKLRFSGYGKHDKIKQGTSWQDQGEGLDHEGTVIGGYLGGELICSMELRFGASDLPLRLEKLQGHRNVPSVDLDRVVEINKLVVHPSVHGSDVVLGMIQRAHAIVMNRGKLDVILMATDQLKALYSSIGAEDLGIRVPHPFLADTHLNIMIVRRETYHDGLRLNPIAWQTVYQVAHEFYSQVGLATPRKYSVMDKSKLWVGKLVMKHRGLSKKPSSKKPAPQTQAPTPSSSSKFVDLKWTNQDILASVMFPYILEAEAAVGQKIVFDILSGLEVPRSYIEKQTNWLSMKFLNDFLEEYGKHSDVPDLSRRAGIRSMKKDVIGLNFYLLKHFVSPEIAFQSFEKIMTRFNRTRTYEVKDFAHGRVKVLIGAQSQKSLPKDRSSCANWQASFEAYIELMTGHRGVVQKTACCYDGDKACVYEIEWKKNSKAAFQVAVTALGGIAAATCYVLLAREYGSLVAGAGTIFSGLVGLAAWLARSHIKIRREKLASESEFQKYQTESNERYTDLQAAKVKLDGMYHEAKLLETVSREIQRNTDLPEILRTTLDAACNKFDFDRAFVMLVDDERKNLVTAAVAGITDNAELLWKYSVDLTAKRDNSQVLSSTYHSGLPILIADVEAHLFQLNEASQKLIGSLQSSSFIIVAIPAVEGRWGVLVADKISASERLDRRDVVLLERLAQQLGNALDKQSTLENEKKIRNYFQRYVPEEVIRRSQGLERPKLGGYQREVICMFLDIRSFTKLTEKLTPNATIEWLNRFFTMAEGIIQSNGGAVDKYLGDGVFATWGTLEGSSLDAQMALASGQKILQDLDDLNEVYAAMGLPAIRIGIGIHRGLATVGNIGSTQRMEYTCIGSVVNHAARLESLCKEYGTEMVVSDALIDRNLVQDGYMWVKKDNVLLRGSEQALTVWIYGDRGLKQDRVIKS